MKTQNQPPPRSHVVAVTAISLYALALLLRLIFIWQSYNLPDFRTPTPGLDICLHWEGAKQIRMGTPDPCFELMPPSAPFNPYFVAFCQTFLGENILLHRIFRAVLSSFSVVLVFMAGLRITRSRVASAAAAFIVATLPSWIHFDTVLVKASIEILMLSLVIWLALRDNAGWRAGRFLALGLGLGVLFSILRFSQGATAIYILVLAVYFLVNRGYGTWLQRLLVVAPMLGLMIGSQMAFKYREPWFGIPATRFLPVDGVHMRIGFQKGATGTYHVLRRFPALPLGHTIFARMAAEARMGRPVTAEEANEFYLAEVRQFIRENPWETLVILGRKLGIFFNNLECRGNYYLPFMKERSPILRFPSIGYGGLVVLAFWGCVALWRRRRFSLLFLLVGLTLAVLTMNLLSFVTYRYRVHATLAMALLAGPGLMLMVESIRNAFGPDRRTRVFLAAMLAATAAVAYGAFRPILVNMQRAMYDTSQRNMAHSIRAEKFAREIQEIEALRNPTFLQREKRATLLHMVARYTDAYYALKAVVAENPARISASRQYLVFLMWAGDYDGAVGFLLQLLKEDPKSVRALVESYNSDSRFWHGSDANLRLIMQALMRDIVLPRFKAKLAELKQPDMEISAEGGADEEDVEPPSYQ
jgi:4-amino-4-deoxy-L-arabinose transferase-like glycosyltransferase